MAFFVDKDIRKATTLPASFYKSQVTFHQLLEQFFVSSWQFVGHDSLLPSPSYAYPFMLLEDSLEEPLVLVRDKENALRCLSNVCTHRGMFLIDQPGKYRLLSCKYHGRAFNLDGQFRSMPEFQAAENFPSEMDHLPKLPLKRLGNFLFTALEPTLDFETVFQPILDRMAWFPFQDLVYHPEASRTYTIKTHWALYCDNYLEGFHIPFVHDDLNTILDYGSYKTETYDYCNLQIGYTDDATEVFDLPKNHIDYGKNVSAYYYWVFPNMMFNFYPWGLSINVVKPLDMNRTKVSFISYVYDPSKLDKGAGSALEKVEREDEFVVENVQKGVRSSFYKAGRFSPTREQGVHHFHTLLSKFLNT